MVKNAEHRTPDDGPSGDFPTDSNHYDSTAPKDKGAYALWCKQQWAEVFRQPELTLEDLAPYRVRAAWRLVREMARARGAISPDMTLAEMEDSAVDPIVEEENNSTGVALIYDAWTVPDQYNIEKQYAQKKNGSAMVDFQYARTHRAIEAAEAKLKNKDAYRPFRWAFDKAKDEWVPQHYAGLPLLPPPVPLPWIDRKADRPKQDYDPSNPEHDPALHAYIQILEAVCQSLYIDLGTENDQNAGKYGMAGLTDPYVIRVAFPSKTQIMMFENLLIQEAFTLLVKQGKAEAIERLKQIYGLQPIEALQLIRIASAKAGELMSGDLEEERAIMTLRFEEVIKHSRVALDPRAEIQALKAISVIKGLAQVSPQDAISDFINVVRSASKSTVRVDNMANRPAGVLPERSFVDEA